MTMVARERVRGAVFIEIVIGLPVMLSLVFILVGIGSLINARETLSSAVGNGVRLARTRGDPIRSHGAAGLQMLAGALTCEAQENLLKYNLPNDQGEEVGESPFTVMSGWNSRIFPLLNGATCKDFAEFFPYYYYLALAYTYEAMRSSVSTLRYPCSPPSGGCLRCTFLNPQAASILASEQSPYLIPPGNLLNEPRFGITCDYAPSELSVRLALALLGATGIGQGGSTASNQQIGTISVTAYSSAP